MKKSERNWHRADVGAVQRDRRRDRAPRGLPLELPEAIYCDAAPEFSSAKLNELLFCTGVRLVIRPPTRGIHGKSVEACFKDGNRELSLKPLKRHLERLSHPGLAVRSKRRFRTGR